MSKHETTAMDRSNQLSDNSSTIIAGASVLVGGFSPQQQDQLLAASTEWIVNRSSQMLEIESSPVAIRVDPPHVPARANERPIQPNPVASSSHRNQIKSSIDSIRNSIQKLESKIRDGFQAVRSASESLAGSSPNLHAPQVPPKAQAASYPQATQAAPVLRQQPSSTRASAAPSLSSPRRDTSLPISNRREAILPPVYPNSPATILPPPNIASRNRSETAIAPQLKAADPLEDPMAANRPRVWRRWVRLDQQLEVRASQWKSKIARFGVGLQFLFNAPTGQEVWTDIDALLHIIDHLIGFTMRSAHQGDTISIVISTHDEDSEWLQVAIRLASDQNRSITKTGKRVVQLDPAHEAKVLNEISVAKKFASMLGGYLDQSSTEHGTCWKLHLPADDLMSWLKRSRDTEHQHVLEVELIDLTGNEVSESLERLTDRALQATFGFRHKVILISQRRYLITCLESHTDIGALRQRFRLQLDRIGASSFPTASLRFDLRIQALGSLSAILLKIEQRLAESRSFKGSTSPSNANSKSTPNIQRFHPAHQVVQGSLAGRKTDTNIVRKNSR